MTDNKVTVEFIGIGADGEALYATNIMPIMLEADAKIVEANEKENAK